jgi:hypothetical protein
MSIVFPTRGIADMLAVAQCISLSGSDNFHMRDWFGPDSTLYLSLMTGGLRLCYLMSALDELWSKRPG